MKFVYLPSSVEFSSVPMADWVVWGTRDDSAVQLFRGIYPVFTRMSGESYSKRFRYLLLCPLLSMLRMPNGITPLCLVSLAGVVTFDLNYHNSSIVSRQ